MFEKSGKFYADWRDRAGRRVRKAFTSERAALKHEAEQKTLARPHGLATGQRSQPYSSPGPVIRTVAAPNTKQQNSSSRKQDRNAPANSPAPTLSKSTKRSTATVIPIAHARRARLVSARSSAGSGQTTARKS